jgi:hypothetical protein
VLTNRGTAEEQDEMLTSRGTAEEQEEVLKSRRDC